MEPKQTAIVISVDLNELGLLVDNGKDIILTPKAEDGLIKLLELKEMVDNAMSTAKKMIEEAALNFNPNFSSVQSDKVKIGYRFFGGKYAVQDGFDGRSLPAELVEVETKIVYKLNTKAVDKFAKTHGSLPLGIVVIPRNKQITIKRIEEALQDDLIQD